jgi:hypothetical protein
VLSPIFAFADVAAACCRRLLPTSTAGDGWRHQCAATVAGACCGCLLRRAATAGFAGQGMATPFSDNGCRRPWRQTAIDDYRC